MKSGVLGAEGSKSRVIRCFVLRATFSLGAGRPYLTGLSMHTRARVPIHMEAAQLSRLKLEAKDGHLSKACGGPSLSSCDNGAISGKDRRL